MKIVVFGASRGVGLEVVKQALEAGHAVTASVRSPSKMQFLHPKLILFQGDAMDEDGVERAIVRQDAETYQLNI